MRRTTRKVQPFYTACSRRIITHRHTELVKFVKVQTTQHKTIISRNTKRKFPQKRKARAQYRNIHARAAATEEEIPCRAFSYVRSRGWHI